jgi:glutathione synthase/RimK-type ligase-like ATP-grasp enzyme
VNRPFKIAVGMDTEQWAEGFDAALGQRIEAGAPVERGMVDLEAHDWRERLEAFDAVIWKPAYMGPAAAGRFKEKIFFIEQHMRKLVVPNFSSVWHFESKIAQLQLMERYGIPHPETVVCGNYEDALERIETARLPVVFKESHGAAAKNVRLVKSRSELRARADAAFCHQLYMRERKRRGAGLGLLIHGLPRRWFWMKALQKIMGREYYHALYWQEFIPGNDADLRITVIGDRHAFGFWRRNRPNDFRASGSGRIDHERPVPEDAVRFCLGVNRRLGFDSMAYDLLFKNGQFVVNEFSYGYMAYAIQGAPGHFELGDDDSLRYVEGRVPPQEIWVDWLLRRAERELGLSPGRGEGDGA